MVKLSISKCVRRLFEGINDIAVFILVKAHRTKCCEIYCRPTYAYSEERMLSSKDCKMPVVAAVEGWRCLRICAGMLSMCCNTKNSSWLA
nr:hypothetical protein CFP56_07299 [Quercus suber]